MPQAAPTARGPLGGHDNGEGGAAQQRAGRGMRSNARGGACAERALTPHARKHARSAPSASAEREPPAVRASAAPTVRASLAAVCPPCRRAT
eukprot:2428507-Prymnesium_polylepis.2